MDLVHKLYQLLPLEILHQLVEILKCDVYHADFTLSDSIELLWCEICSLSDVWSHTSLNCLKLLQLSLSSVVL